MNQQYLDPAFGLGCPAELGEMFGRAWTDWSEEDLALAAQPIDWLGVNYYTRGVMKHDPACLPVKAAMSASRERPTARPVGRSSSRASPTSCCGSRALRKSPLYVTENGSAFFDAPTAHNKRVRDPLRVDYLQRHLRAVHAAVAAGADVRGYMAWSLIDNLEWSLGFSKRFGIVHVDFATQQRTPKDSALYYSRIVATNGAALAGRRSPNRCPERGRTIPLGERAFGGPGRSC